MDMQEAYAKADLERLQKRVYDLLADNEQLRAELNLSRGVGKSLEQTNAKLNKEIAELQAALANRAG